MFDSAIKFQQSAMRSLQEDLDDMVRELIDNKCGTVITANYTLNIVHGAEFTPVSQWNYKCAEATVVSNEQPKQIYELYHGLILEHTYRDLITMTLDKAATELSKLFFTMDNLEVKATWTNKHYDETTAFGEGGFRVNVEIIPTGKHYPQHT